MFDFLNKHGNSSSQQHDQPPEWLAMLNETQERLFVFMEKLEARMDELIESAIPELLELKAENERAFGTLFNGIRGQLGSVRDKARATYEDKVEGLYYRINCSIDMYHPYQSHLSSFRNACSERYHIGFETRYDQNIQKLEQTQFTDYEALYQELMEEHDRVKNQFKCHQCGDAIPLTKLYFTVSYLSCPSCHTRNTFTPSTLASRLDEIGRGLAEQRTQHLLDRYQDEQKMERALYHQVHKLKLTNRLAKTADVATQLEELERKRQESIILAPQLYQQYQRAMFDEWKKLVPDLAEQIENFYQGLQRKNF